MDIKQFAVTVAAVAIAIMVREQIKTRFGF